MDPEAFKNPPNKFRVLQIIHGFDKFALDKKKPGKEGIKYCLSALQKMGVGGIVFNVSFKNYLRDEEQWKIMLEGVEIAEKMGFVLWLYDEEGYPSGEAGTLVLESNPEYQSIGLLRLSDGSGGVKYEVQKVYEGTHATENVHAKRPYVNIINKEAIKKFISLTHDEYNRRIENLGKRVDAIFTDEPSLMTPYIRRGQKFPPAIPWVEDLPAVFKEKKGYSLEPNLEKLFTDTGDDYRKVRCDFYDVVADLCAERYFGQIQEWCHRTGVLAGGHNLCEENIIWHVFFYGDFYRQMRRYDLPGIDILNSKPEELIAGNGFMTPKIVSSVSHVIGSPRTMSETSDHSQRSRGGSTTLREIIGTANLQYALGVNLITSYYGHFWKEIGTSAFWSNNVDLPGAAEEYKKYCECVARLSYVLTGGRHVCNVGVYYPIWGVLSNFTPTGVSIYEQHPDETVRMIADEFTKICQLLVRNQIDFDILDDRAILDCKIEDARLKINDESYKVIILPPTDTIGVKTLKKLKDFIAGGGKVVSVGLMPKFGVGTKENDAEVEKLAKEIFNSKGEFLPGSNGLLEHLKKLEINDFSLEVKNPCILYKHICKGSQHIYFITNITASPQEIEAIFSVRGKPSVWHPETGEIKEAKFKEAVGRIKMELKLKDYEGVFVIIL